MITDEIASPLQHENYYTEKFLYMPQSFFVNSFAYLEPIIMPPKLQWPDGIPTPQQSGHFIVIIIIIIIIIITKVVEGNLLISFFAILISN